MEIELYNLRTDPMEQQNIALDHPDIVNEMAAIMSKEHTVPRIDKFKMKPLGDIPGGDGPPVN